MSRTRVGSRGDRPLRQNPDFWSGLAATERRVRIPTKPNGSSDGRRARDPSEAEHLVRAKASSPTGAP
jgi:hypothetical protein